MNNEALAIPQGMQRLSGSAIRNELHGARALSSLDKIAARPRLPSDYKPAGCPTSTQFAARRRALEQGAQLESAPSA